ncbi:MAG: hypothetical protein FWE05_13795, partial [Defluviitaleaceae bacterium]|nr:hypothetical protein [Defluviitaleaceae bacterium]
SVAGGIVGGVAGVHAYRNPPPSRAGNGQIRPKPPSNPASSPPSPPPHTGGHANTGTGTGQDFSRNFENHMVALTETQNEIARQQRALRSAGSKVVTAQDLYDSLRQGEDYHWLLIRHLLGLPYHALTNQEYLALAVLFASLEDEYIGRFLSYFVDEVDSFRLNEFQLSGTSMEQRIQILSQFYDFTDNERHNMAMGIMPLTAWELCPNKTRMLHSLLYLVQGEDNFQTIQQRQVILLSLLDHTSPTLETMPVIGVDQHHSHLLISRQGSRPTIRVNVEHRNARLEVITAESRYGAVVFPSQLPNRPIGVLMPDNPGTTREWFGLNARGWNVIPTSDVTTAHDIVNRHLDRFHVNVFTVVPTPTSSFITSNVRDELAGIGIGAIPVAGPVIGPIVMGTVSTIRDIVEQQHAQRESQRQLESARVITDALRDISVANQIPMDFILELQDNHFVRVHVNEIPHLTQAHIDVINYHGHFSHLEHGLTIDYLLNNLASIHAWWVGFNDSDEGIAERERIQEDFNEISHPRRHD